MKRSWCTVRVLTSTIVSNSSCLLSKASAFSAVIPTSVCLVKNGSPCSSIHLITWGKIKNQDEYLRHLIYHMAQVTCGKIATCDWLLTWQDF